MTSILERIVATKRREVDAARQAVPESQLRDRLEDAPTVRDFFQPLAKHGPIRLIAEVKKASPSRGVIRENFDAIEIAGAYASEGATCISVLTDEPYFQGHLDYLRQIRAAIAIPVLRKDFVLDVYQVVEARLAGADAVLPIAECLDQCHLQKLYRETLDLAMTPLVELYEPDNLARVLDLGATLIGINNRNLHSFETDLHHTIRMREQIPSGCVVVGESGIHSHEDLRLLERHGVDAVLVGEHLMSQPDVAQAVRQLLGSSQVPRNASQDPLAGPTDS